MGRVNWPRVVVGGLFAGLVINLGELASAVLLREQYRDAMERIGRPLAPPTVSAFALSLAITFGIGIFAVWLYAAVRPRFGPGPRTAVIAAIATLLIQGSAIVRFSAAGLIPAQLLMFTSVFALLEFVLGTLLGAWLYKETVFTEHASP